MPDTYHDQLSRVRHLASQPLAHSPIPGGDQAALSAVLERLDAFAKWKLSIEESGDKDGWARVSRLELENVRLQTEVRDLTATINRITKGPRS